MKKILTAILSAMAVVMLLCGIAACTDGPGAKTRHTVTFQGEGIETSTQIVEDGGLVLEPKEPTREDGKVFYAWVKEGEEEPYDFSTPVHSDLTLNAKWVEMGESGLLGEGTSASPYLLRSAEDLVTFSGLVNDDTAEYYKKWYRLEADVDLSNENYKPAGKSSEENEDVLGFMGVFDGNGHTVSGLTLEDNRRTGYGYYGLFGETFFANIYDLTVEFDITFKGFTEEINFYAGGVAGLASLTNFRNVRTVGAFHADALATNTVTVGGIAGMLYSGTHDGQGYIAYVENCSSEITVDIVNEGEDDGGSLESAFVGGLFGNVYTMSGAAAIVNCASSGTVYGGKYTGGLIGGILFDNVSVINCYSSATVKPSAEEVSYAGGLVGVVEGDSIILDSVSTGAVTGKRGTSAQATSGYGGIVGDAVPDDYGSEDGYYTAGTAVVNCYAAGRLSGSGCSRNTLETGIDKNEITADWVKTTLGWDECSWDLVNFVPTDKLASDLAGSYTVTLKDGANTETKTYQTGEGYNLLGTLEAPKSEGANIFVDWAYDTYEEARTYMPVVKNMTFTARRENATDLIGVYEGKTEWGQSSSNDRGVIEFRGDGTFRWIESTVTMGTYKFVSDKSGNRYVFLYVPGDEYVGTYKAGTITIERYEGSMSVLYTFKYNADITTIGEYFSEDGDYLVFSGASRIDYQSDALGGQSLRINYTKDGNTITAQIVDSTEIGSFYTSFVITMNDNGTVTVNATGKPGTANIVNRVFTPWAGADYADEPFIKDYVTGYVNSSSTSDAYIATNYCKVTFKADGTMEYTSGAYSGFLSTSEGRYFWFPEKGIIKLTLDEQISTLYYNAEGDFFYGDLRRGTTTVCPTVFVPYDGEKLQAFTYESRDTLTVFVYGDKTFVMKDGEYAPEITVTGEFKKGSIVTIEGVKYRVVIDEASIGTYNEYTGLLLVGPEEGTYTYENKTYALDGIGGVRGEVSGKYYVYGDFIVVLLDNDTIFGFDYTAARAADGAITVRPQDGKEGVWYAPNNNASEEEPADEKYYRYVIDGYGHVTIFYNRAGEYVLNWGGNEWGTYTATETGINARYNQYNSATIVFYYEKQVVYTAGINSSGGVRQGATYVKDGYKGPTTPPVIPASWEGSYTGQKSDDTTLVVNFRKDGTGTVGGVPFVGIYDGDKTVRFTASGVDYTLVFDTTITISFGSENVTLTKGGAITEKIPAAFAGTWTGIAEGFGSGSSEHTFTIGAEGSVVFDKATSLTGVKWDGQSLTITGTGSDMEFTLTFTEEGGVYTLTAEWKNEENMVWIGTFTKSAED